MFWSNLTVYSCYFIVCVLTAITRQLLTFVSHSIAVNSRLNTGQRLYYLLAIGTYTRACVVKPPCIP